VVTPSFSHKRADACFSVEESIRDAFTRPGLSFQSIFLQEIPPLHASESLALSVYELWEIGYIFLLLAIPRQACTLFSSFTHTKFSFGTWGIFAHMICFSCWKWTSSRFEAGGNVQSSGLGSILEWVRLAWPWGVAVGALHGQGLIHVNALIAFVFFLLHFLS
jgi:hypothetical protein